MEDAFGKKFEQILANDRQKQIEPERPTRQFDTFFDSEQKWLLFNCAHLNQQPICAKPAVRILGLFRTQEEAVHHAKSCGIVDSAMYLAEAGKKVLIAQSLTRQQDPRYQEIKINELTRRYLQEREIFTSEFKQTKESKSFGKTGLSHDARAAKVESAPLSVSERHVEVTRASSSAQVRGQECAVISVIRDNLPSTLRGETAPEPVVIVWRAFSSENDAVDFIRSSASQHVTTLNLDVVSMYEWLFPEHVDSDKIKEAYRDPEQDQIMNQRKASQRSVNLFENFCKQEGITMPVTEVSVDPTTLQPVVQKTVELTPTSMTGQQKDADGVKDLEVHKDR